VKIVAEANDITQQDRGASNLNFVEDYIDYYLEKAERTFKRSNTAIQRAAERARDYKELKIVVDLAKRASALADQMGEELKGEMNGKQQEIYNAIQQDTKVLYGRLRDMLKAESEGFNGSDNRAESEKLIEGVR
jgi:hypothetical protein